MSVPETIQARIGIALDCRALGAGWGEISSDYLNKLTARMPMVWNAVIAVNGAFFDESKVWRTKLIFQIQIIISKLVNVLTIFSIHFATNLINKSVSFHGKHTHTHTHTHTRKHYPVWVPTGAVVITTQRLHKTSHLHRASVSALLSAGFIRPQNSLWSQSKLGAFQEMFRVLNRGARHTADIITMTCTHP